MRFKTHENTEHMNDWEWENLMFWVRANTLTKLWVSEREILSNSILLITWERAKRAKQHASYMIEAKTTLVTCPGDRGKQKLTTDSESLKVEVSIYGFNSRFRRLFVELREIIASWVRECKFYLNNVLFHCDQGANLASSSSVFGRVSKNCSI